jgi:hypothetical protein
MEGSGQESASQPMRFTLGETAPGIGWAGRHVGRTSGPNALEKRKVSCLCPEPNHDYSVIQHVVWELHRSSSTASPTQYRDY